MTRKHRLIGLIDTSVFTLASVGAICNYEAPPIHGCNTPEYCGWGSNATGIGPSSYICYQSSSTCCQCHIYDLYCVNPFEQTFTVKVKLANPMFGYTCSSGECIAPK